MLGAGDPPSSLKASLLLCVSFHLAGPPGPDVRGSWHRHLPVPLRLASRSSASAVPMRVSPMSPLLSPSTPTPGTSKSRSAVLLPSCLPLWAGAVLEKGRVFGKSEAPQARPPGSAEPPTRPATPELPAHGDLRGLPVPRPARPPLPGGCSTRPLRPPVPGSAGSRLPRPHVPVSRGLPSVPSLQSPAAPRCWLRPGRSPFGSSSMPSCLPPLRCGCRLPASSLLQTLTRVGSRPPRAAPPGPPLTTLHQAPFSWPRASSPPKGA